MLFQILFHRLVHNISERHILLDSEVFHPGMNTLVDNKIAMHGRFFSALTGAGSFFCVDFPVDDSKPSSPLLMPFFNESLLLISSLL